MRIAIAEAKAQFAEIVRRAEAGEEIELTRHGRPVARIVGPGPDARKPLLGALRGRITIAPDFDELPPGFLDALGAPIEPVAMRDDVPGAGPSPADPPKRDPA